MVNTLPVGFGERGRGLCCGIAEGEVPGTGKCSSVEPAIGIDANNFACVLFDVCVVLDGFQQREETRDPHCRNKRL